MTTIIAGPAPVNLNLYAGDDFTLPITVVDPGGGPADLTGQAARADIRADPTSDVVASFTATIAANVITLTLPGTATAVLPAAAVWDCQLAGATVWTLAAGAVRTTPQITV